MKARLTVMTGVVLVWFGWADPLTVAGSSLDHFFSRHCFGGHSGAAAEAKLDLEALPRDFSDPATLKAFTHIHDRIVAGEMPPATRLPHTGQRCGDRRDERGTCLRS